MDRVRGNASVYERTGKGEGMTKEEAITYANTKWWEGKSAQEIVDFQLYEEKLCMPFGLFHEAMETVLGRGVWPHEFTDTKVLRDELFFRKLKKERNNL